MDATPDLAYEGYGATLQPFGGEGEEPERVIPFGFVPTRPAEAADYWADCGVVD